jgi:hypothetical protein
VCLYVYPPSVARQQPLKHVPVAKNINARIEEGLKVPISVRFVSYQMKFCVCVSQNFLLFERSSVRFSAGTLAILIEVFRVYPQSLQANSNSAFINHPMPYSLYTDVVK